VLAICTTLLGGPQAVTGDTARVLDEIGDNHVDENEWPNYRDRMARRRTRTPPIQRELFPRHGGARPGAGRKRKPGSGSPHQRRPTLKAWQPVHVVLRVARSVGALRTGTMYRALREATLTVARRELSYRTDGAFRIVHISIQRTHVHLLVEADHRTALSRGMQSFQISAARHINRVAGRRGTVFPDRFHQVIISSPRQARHTLAYVLNNWRRHREDQRGRGRGWKVDPFSTGVLFPGWKEDLDEVALRRWRASYDPLVVYQPRTWLLREGWRKRGLIAHGEVPRAAA
jgi:REP element-mobilizing transposase RayT